MLELGTRKEVERLIGEHASRTEQSFWHTKDGKERWQLRGMAIAYRHCQRLLRLGVDPAYLNKPDGD